MNRRGFLLGVAALPASVKAAAEAPNLFTRLVQECPPTFRGVPLEYFKRLGEPRITIGFAGLNADGTRCWSTKTMTLGEYANYPWSEDEIDLDG